MPRTSKPKQELHAYGVLHSTLDEEAEEDRPSGDIKKLTKHLKQLKRQGIDRVGVERKTPFPNRPLIKHTNLDPEDRFWRALDLRAKRIGIELVPLEEHPEAQAINKLSDIIQTGTFVAMVPGGWQRHLQIREHEIASSPQTTAVRKMLDEVTRHFKTKGPATMELVNALDLHRSLQMAERARQQGLSHIVIGYVHAHHLNNITNTSMTLIGTARREEAPTGDYATYARMLPLIERLAKIAKTETTR